MGGCPRISPPFFRLCLPRSRQLHRLRVVALIAAIVLSAGKSERMGRPKALLEFRGKTFLDHILAAISQSPIGHIAVVTGHHREAIEKAAALPGAVFNANYAQGMITSVQTGIRALPKTVSGAALFLVDHPLIRPATIRQLVDHLEPGSIALPVHAGRRGHPVLFAVELFDEILSLTVNEGLNVVVRRDARRIIEVRVDDPGVLRDVDTPEEFEALLAEYDARF